MIPKTIHYCWFGPKKYNKTIDICIETWHKYLPDYEFILWSEQNYKMDIPFCIEAYNAGKYAFVSDYVRLWALYKYGGIYLDTDMFVIKDFDSLLDNELFLGWENVEKLYISAGIIGSIKEHKFIEILLNRYQSLNFNQELTKIAIPKIITDSYYKYILPERIKIYNYDYFYPFPYEQRNNKSDFMNYNSKNTLAIHLWDLSWRSDVRKFKEKIKAIIGSIVKSRRLNKFLTVK
jgi:mannosyltransferase OCH1-like enzyme